MSIVSGTLGAVMQSSAIRDAAGQQADATNRATDMQERARQAAVASLSPFRSLGLNAIPSLLSYYADPNYFKFKQANDQLSSTTYQPDALTSKYGDITNPQTFQNFGPHGGRGLFDILANRDENVPLSVRNIAQDFLAEQNATARSDEGSTSYGFTEPDKYAARFKEALAQQDTNRQATEQNIQDLMLQSAQENAVPKAPAIPASLTAYLSADNPAFQRYQALLGTPTERFSTERFTPQPYQETPEFLAKKALGEKYANRDLAARGLFSSGRATEVLNDFVTRLMAEDSDRQFQRQLTAYDRNFGRDVTAYGLNQEATNQDIVRAETGYNAGLGREMGLYNLALGAYGRDFNAAQTRYANLFGLANLGQSSAAGVGNANLSSGNAAANLAVAGGNAQAAATAGIGKTYADFLGGIGRTGATLGTLYGMGAFKGAGGGSGYNLQQFNNATGIGATQQEFDAYDRADKLFASGRD